MNKLLKWLSSRAAKKLNLQTLNCHAELVSASVYSKTLKQVQGDKRAAFTLAEVLITITIIGVVAAMTIPNLIADYEARQYKTQSTNFQRKLGEALRVMNAQNNLRGFSSTRDFVTELSRNFKITKVCDTVTDCFVETINKKDGTTIDTSTLTTSTSLGHSEFGTNTVGVQFGNGITGIIAYNKKFSKNNDSDVVKLTESTDGKLKTVSLSTDVLSLIYDVSGYEKPNAINEDILSVNASIGGINMGECSGTMIGDYCTKNLGTNYDSIPCTDGLFPEYCGDSPSGSSNDYWAGANRACDKIGMTLPTPSKLSVIYIYAKDDNIEIPDSVEYFTADNGSGITSTLFRFNTGTSVYMNGAKIYKRNVMCVNR